MRRTARKGLRLLPEEQAQLEWLTAQGYGATESEAARRAIREAYERRTEMPVSKWSLQKIKDTVLDDFNVIIDTDTAADIRDADARGILMWTPAHLVTTDGIRIEPNNDRLPRQYSA